MGDNILVEDSYYFDPCPVEREFNLYWEAHEGYFANGAPGISEIFDYEYRIPFENEFDFEHCGF